MENREQQILSEIKTMMSSIRIQLEKLDAKMVELQGAVDPGDVAAQPIDLDIEEVIAPVEAVEETVQEQEIVMEIVEEDFDASEPEQVIEEQDPVVEVAPQTVDDLPEPVVEISALPEPVEEDDDLPLFAQPKPIFEAAQESPKVKRTVMDVMSEKQSWRTDMPGTPVRDILSAISLNDRVQFINVLFKSDPSLFQQARARINLMENLDQVVDYVTHHFDWDMNSPAVYRFMMAVRRKVKS